MTSGREGAAKTIFPVAKDLWYHRCIYSNVQASNWTLEVDNLKNQNIILPHKQMKTKNALKTLTGQGINNRPHTSLGFWLRNQKTENIAKKEQYLKL